MTYKENIKLNNQNMQIDIDNKKNKNIEFDIDSKDDKINVEIGNSNTVYTGTRNYEELKNQPKINGITLIGNKTSKDIKVQDEMDALLEADIDKIIYGG